jgi:dTMP kinase
MGRLERLVLAKYAGELPHFVSSPCDNRRLWIQFASMTSPCFIVVEGIDGAGKSFVAGAICNYLQRQARRPVLTSEPTNGEFGRRIRKLARVERPSASEEYHLFLQDRAEHVEKFIKPQLAAGHDVICDRYFLSSVAYQGARGLDPEELLNDSIRRFPIPHLALYIDIPPEVSRLRTAARGHTDRFDDASDFAVVRKIYCAMRFPWLRRIDGTLPKEAVLAECHSAVDTVFS